jgi:quinolinate synthase
VELVSKTPGARVVAHPECEPSLLARADYIGSTSALLEYVRVTDAPAFIVATEAGILHQMKKAAPQKVLIPLPGMDENCACNECPHMKRNTLEKMYLALRDLQPRLEMDESLRLRALAPLDAMMALG